MPSFASLSSALTLEGFILIKSESIHVYLLSCRPIYQSTVLFGEVSVGRWSASESKYQPIRAWN